MYKRRRKKIFEPPTSMPYRLKQVRAKRNSSLEILHANQCEKIATSNPVTPNPEYEVVFPVNEQGHFVADPNNPLHQMWLED